MTKQALESKRKNKIKIEEDQSLDSIINTINTNMNLHKKLT
jgi:hypothetical protein